MSVAEKALAELTGISSQVRAAAVLGAGGETLASTLPAERADAFAAAARRVLEQADALRGEAAISQIEVAAPEGSLLVVREGERAVVAATDPEPTSGLVFFDLKACLRSAADPEQPKRRRAASAKPKAAAKPKAKPKAEAKPKGTTKPKPKGSRGSS